MHFAKVAVLYHSIILIHLFHLQAMSSDSDDFVFSAPVRLRTEGGGRTARSSGEGVEVAAPAVRTDASVSDSDVEFVVPASRAVGQKRRRRTRAPLQTAGSFWMIAATEDLETHPPACNVHGLVEMQWQLLREGVSRESGNRDGVCGTLRYSVRRLVLLENVQRMVAGFDARRNVAALHALAAIGDSKLQGSGDRVATFLKAAKARLEHELLLCSAPEEAVLRAATEPGTHVFRDVAIYRRWADPASFIANLPKKTVLKRWRKLDQHQEVVLTDSDESAPPKIGELSDPLLYIPPDRISQGRVPRGRTVQGRAPVDPVRLVHALGVVRHLRSPKLFVVALDDTYEYLFQDQEVEPRENKGDPSRRTLQRAMARADFVSMSLTRRMFHKWRQDDAIKAINIYSDASPVVGVELQGMLIDVSLKNGEVIRLILPGSPSRTATRTR